MSDEIRSFPRWVEGAWNAALYNYKVPGNHAQIRADIVVRTPETLDVEFPGVGAKMVDHTGETVTIEGVPFASSLDGGVFVPVNSTFGASIRRLSKLHPLPPLKKYIAVYEGESVEDVRKRFSVPKTIVLEEQP